MDRLWQEADVCASVETLGKSQTGGVSVELQTNRQTNKQIQTSVVT